MGLLRRLMGRSEDQTPSERPDQGLLELLAEGGLAAYQRQLAFAGIADDLPWLLDQDTATLRLGEDLALPAQLLGSVAYDAGTWLWAWANPSVEPRMLGVAERARSLGESRRIPSLTEAEVPLDTIVDGHLVALAVSGALDCDAYYRCPYAGGEAYAIVEVPQIRTVADTDAAHAFGATVRHAITEVPWLLSRQSIEAHLRSTGLDALVEGSTISIRDGPRLTFDDLGRVTAYEETLRA